MPRPLGRYMLLKRIARGGMGEVLLASTMGIEGAERPVIVKIIRREHKKDPNFYARFLDETRVQAQLSHSGVAQVLDAAIDDATGEPYAVVEHVEGKSLGELRQRAIQTGQRLNWADAVALAQLIAEGLAYVHERRDASGRPLAIVHRDLSPQNVMVSFTGEVKIIDFGTARGQNRRCHTVAGVVFAKPGYVAPEVANGDSGDARVDLYALGIMLWELCAGRRFLQGDAQAHLAKVARNEMSPPAIASEIGAPEGLDAAIAKLTEFDRDARYLSARSAATELAKLLSAATALPTGERGVRPRVAHIMQALFTGEPLASRKEFARLMAATRGRKNAQLVSEPPKPEAPVLIEKKTEEAPKKTDDTALAGSRHRPIREIGRGASSVVYEAEHETDKERVALKVLSGEGSTEAANVERFRRGARALSLIEHENLVRIRDVGSLEDGRPFCTMDLYEGETLKDYLTRERGADYREAVSMAVKILSALEVAHRAGIVHRDIQPSNVFLTSTGGLKLLDFGLAGGQAISLDTAEKGPSRGVVLHGTPEYMAPEQATNGDVDGRADLYSVGCLVFEMLTGQLPFEGKSAVAILDQKRQGSPPSPSDVAPTRAIPAQVSAVIMKSLARHPSARFQSATEMRKALETALVKSRPYRTSRRAIASVAAMMAILTIAFGFGLFKSERLRARVPARVAALFVKPAEVSAEPILDTTPIETDKQEVPLGEVALDAVPTPASEGPAPAEAPSEKSADPALEKPEEHDDVLAAADGEMTGASLADEIPPPSELAEGPIAQASPPKPAAKHRRHKKSPSKKPAKKTEKSEPSKKSESSKKADKASSGKALSPEKDDAASRRKKRKNKTRVAKAH